jgi:hypothetical protein
MALWLSKTPFCHNLNDFLRFSRFKSHSDWESCR